MSSLISAVKCSQRESMASSLELISYLAKLWFTLLKTKKKLSFKSVLNTL